MSHLRHALRSSEEKENAGFLNTLVHDRAAKNNNAQAMQDGNNKKRPLSASGAAELEKEAIAKGSNFHEGSKQQDQRTREPALRRSAV